LAYLLQPRLILALQRLEFLAESLACALQLRVRCLQVGVARLQLLEARLVLAQLHQDSVAARDPRAERLVDQRHPDDGEGDREAAREGGNQRRGMARANAEQAQPLLAQPPAQPIACIRQRAPEHHQQRENRKHRRGHRRGLYLFSTTPSG
jgi:hypothetical protein